MTSTMTLWDLPLLDSAVIQRCSNSRLEDLGFVPGERVCVLVRKRTTLVVVCGVSRWALRDHEALCVECVETAA